MLAFDNKTIIYAIFFNCSIKIGFTSVVVRSHDNNTACGWGKPE